MVLTTRPPQGRAKVRCSRPALASVLEVTALYWMQASASIQHMPATAVDYLKVARKAKACTHC
eukprot:4119138-Amphidinium_carterae.1